MLQARGGAGSTVPGSARVPFPSEQTEPHNRGPGSRALNRHRGKSGQQTVRVEHVTVKDGGQAVIGPVTAGGEGG